MSRRIKIPQTDSRLKIENFHKRWNIQLNDVERWENFKNRVLNSYTSGIGKQIMFKDGCEDEFFTLIGIHRRKVDHFLDFNILDNGFKDSPTYNYLVDINDVKKFIFGLEVILHINSIEQKFKTFFLEDIQDSIIITGVPLEIKQTDTDILFYPAGAKLLDEKLINDNLDWLSAYPKSYETFKKSLSEVGLKDKERNVVDNLRLSLELLLKDILKNRKSLENQKSDIGIYLKNKNVSTEISNLFWTVLDYYSKYQNNKAKHENIVSTDEVEFILYLTGVLMRFVLTK